jgi:hypothetical protein
MSANAGARALPLSQGQKSFVRNLVVFDGVDADLGHLHSLFRILIGSIDIKSNNEGIASYERTAYFGIVHLHVLFPPIVFTADLIDTSHFSRDVSHLAGFDANNVFRIKIIDRLFPLAPFAQLYQSHRNVFRTHISSIVLVFFRGQRPRLQKQLASFIRQRNSVRRQHDLLHPTILLSDVAQ